MSMQEYSGPFTHSLVHITGPSQSSQCNANIVDQHHHGRTTSTEVRGVVLWEGVVEHH